MRSGSEGVNVVLFEVVTEGHVVGYATYLNGTDHGLRLNSIE